MKASSNKGHTASKTSAAALIGQLSVVAVTTGTGAKGFIFTVKEVTTPRLPPAGSSTLLQGFSITEMVAAMLATAIGKFNRYLNGFSGGEGATFFVIHPPGFLNFHYTTQDLNPATLQERN